VKVETIYLDTNIISRIADLSISEETADAYARLAKMQTMGEVRFVTSYKTAQEILGTENKIKNAVLHFFYTFICNVPFLTVHLSHGGAIGTSAIGETHIGGGWNEIDPIYTKLGAIFDADDAEHVFQALMAKCDYFMTLDERSILRRVSSNLEEVQKICGSMRLVSPADAVRLIESERRKS
jgi:hypothetical protein